MRISKTTDRQGIPTFLLEDGRLVRRFLCVSDHYILEKVSIKRAPKGRPTDVHVWFHRGADAERMAAIIQKYEIAISLEGPHAPGKIRRL